MIPLLLSLALIGADPKMPSDETIAKYEERKLAYEAEGQPAREVAYRLLKPAKIEPGKKYPVVLFLHGAGERGSDNARQLLYLPTWMADAEHQERYPCFLIAPQCPSSKWWAGRGDGSEMPIVEKLLDATLAEFPIDPNRVYLTGLSMGGYGSWALAARRPEQYAAVVPICGGGDPKQAEKLVKIPIWAVHGNKDSVVPVSQSRTMIEAMRAAGGDPKLTELDGVGHDSWTPAYNDPEGVLPWMFQQSK